MIPAAFVLFLAVAPNCFGAGFANGVKIGEVTHDRAILWTRLTKHAEAENRVKDWQADSPNWVVRGAEGRVRFEIREQGSAKSLFSEWTEVGASTDFCHQTTFGNLKPDTEYECYAEGESGRTKQVRLRGTFTTAPLPSSQGSVRFTVSTCQEFETRDNADDGHKIYRSMAKLEPAFFVQTGDTVYYDRKEPLSKTMALARYRWNRMYALPSLRDFHANVPSYWMHDDHDVLKNDAWPGQTYGELTWKQGLQIRAEQVPWPEKPYRTYRWGKDLQIWLPEGREFRSPNRANDGPDKGILGKEQWSWLATSLKKSDATFKFFISATPVVGPDRKGKNDNHANAGFQHEGDQLRELLSSVPNCVVINGDRHWQYHSIDKGTGLQEFGCGASTDKHAGGWNPKNKRPEHQFLRVKGGFLSVYVDGKTATIRHHDVNGEHTYQTTLQSR